MFEDFYHLSGPPFQLKPDPRFYFASQGHSRALAYLKYGLVQREGFVLITGDIGAGKTTLLQAIVRGLDHEEIVSAQIVSTQLDAEDLLRAIAIAFGLAVGSDTKAHLLARIEAFLISLARENRRALLIVDEAQNLKLRAMEELRMLSNLQLGEQVLLQSYLVGQPELREMLRSPSLRQLRQRVSASYHLGPLNREETRAYVLHRLTRVGWKGDPQLDDAIFAPLHDVSRGIPRMINAVANRLLLGACLSERHRIGAVEMEQTLDELRQEIGVETISSPPPVTPREPAGSSGEPMRSFQMSAMAARLDRIEKNLETLIMMIKGTEVDTKVGPGIAARTGQVPRWRQGIGRR
jgi:general secretion pathway protein A